MITKLQKNIILVTAFVFFLFPISVFGAEFILNSPREIGKGGDFKVDVIFNTKDSVNAVEGRLTFPLDLLEIKEIKNGNSIINFWVMEPNSDSPGSIAFSGITPGGFKGENNQIFSVIFTTKKEGNGSVNLLNVRSLLNDGKGTEESVTVSKSDFTIQGQATGGDVSAREDTELPESFQPEVSRTPYLEDGKWLVFFSTTDKNSGIKSYSVKESRQRFFAFLDEYVIATSPYLLTDQELYSYIFIKVLDNAGNERVVEISPRYPLAWYQNSSYWITIIIFILVISGIKKWKRRSIKEE